MKIAEFFELITKQDCPKFESQSAETIDEFFENCIRKNLPKKGIVAQWDSLLKKYIKDPEAVFFIRRYASTKDENKNWDIRRGFLTVCNNVKYVFVDNFFSQYFYAMAINEFVPDYVDFKDYIINRKIPYGYSNACEEKNHQAYLKGHTYPLNRKGWKLSHIFPANEDYLGINYRKYASDLFPRGTYGDFVKQGDFQYPCRIVNKHVSQENLDIIIAHFLRIVHPINYFITPKVKYQMSGKGIKDIGEFPEMINYMKNVLNKEYGQIFIDYMHLIKADPQIVPSYANTQIGLYFGTDVSKSTASTTGIDVPSEKRFKSQTVLKADFDNHLVSPVVSFSDRMIANSIKAYLFDGLSLRRIEYEILELKYKKNGGGWKVKSLLESKSIHSKNLKKLFYGKTVEEAIDLADGDLKVTLIWMKSNLDATENAKA